MQIIIIIIFLKIEEDCTLKVYVSFKSLFHVPHDLFEKIDEWNSTDERCYVIGTIRFATVKESNWWKKEGVSLILLPNAIVNQEARNIKREYSIV